MTIPREVVELVSLVLPWMLFAVLVWGDDDNQVSIETGREDA